MKTDKDEMKEAENFTIEYDVDKDGVADFVLKVNKDSVHTWALRLIKWIAIKFVL